MRVGTLTASYLLDWVLGDPESLPHPVRGIGHVIQTGEWMLRGEGRSAEFVGGTLLTGVVVLGSACSASKLLKNAKGCNAPLGRAAEIWLAASCLATRNLLDEAGAVVRLLDESDLDAARRQLARIVGRDTATLSANEIARAVIETLAESLCDGIIAPLFYLTLGGVPLAMAYKATNTLDSMIGHRDERYEWFGKAAARLDDVANLVPSRISAILICGAAALLYRGRYKPAWRTWWCDARKHASPNAGQPESAMAGALGVQLGGVNQYSGARVETPLLGAGLPTPDARAARRALHITAVASLLGFAFGCLALARRSNG
ncbi:MAG TPA: adenosylcobinamide-phosphate synthase CbiB [Acidisarcina sp.]|nr:adenosylcobinamide-phosphate synthase CbiB [Acidisarcina sp.]